MSKILNWVVETITTAALLQDRLSFLRMSGHDVLEGDILYNGTDYTIRYLAGHHHFGSNAGVDVGINSLLGYSDPDIPWTVVDIITLNWVADYMSFAAFQDNTFLIGYTTGWDVDENEYTKLESKLKIQAADYNGNTTFSVKNIGTATYYPDMATLDNGNVVVTWIDTSINDNVKFTIIKPDGSYAINVGGNHEITVGTSDGTTYRPSVANLDTGGFMVLTMAGPSHLHNVVYDADGVETARPDAITDIDFDGLQTDCQKTNEGKVVMAYIDDAGEFGFAIFDADGTLNTDVGALTAVGSQSMPSVCVLTNNNYFFSWYDGDADEGKYAIYNTSNVEVKAPTALANKKPHKIIALTHGGVMVLTARQSGGWKSHFYSAAGTFQETLDIQASGHTEELVMPCAVQLTHGRIIACASKFQFDPYFAILQGT